MDIKEWIANASLEDLKQARYDINGRARELEQTAVEELKARALSLGYAITQLNGQQATAPQKVAPKFRFPDGSTWSGRGRKPKIALELEEQGRDISEFAI
jgi:DNA-binding protein H-NS